MGNNEGRRLGNFRLERLIGSGGFGEVYLARHIYIDTEAAIKIIHARMEHSEIEQFAAEARIIARLKHPHITQLLDFGIADGTAYLAMEYAPNGSLQERLPRGAKIPLPTVVHYVKQIASALQYAHDHKIIHRDIKPSNMLLSQNDDVLLSDFGIAVTGYDTNSRPTQAVVGTPIYMAPEQVMGKPSRASDQYALAVVVYEWLSGVLPFKGHFNELAFQHLYAPPPSLRESISISLQIDSIILKALAKDPQERFATIQAFSNALEEAAKDITIGQIDLPNVSVSDIVSLENGENNKSDTLTGTVFRTGASASQNEKAYYPPLPYMDGTPTVPAPPPTQLSSESPPTRSSSESTLSRGTSLFRDLKERAQDVAQETVPIIKNIGLYGLEWFKKQMQAQPSPSTSSSPSAHHVESAAFSPGTLLFESSKLPQGQLKDFFISYHKEDQLWARWVSWQLKEIGYSYILPVYSFHLGSNFEQEIFKATAKAKRVIFLLSLEYFEALNNQSLIRTLSKSNLLEQHAFLPICVRECGRKFKKSLELINHIDLVGLDENAARDMLTAGIRGEHTELEESPVFPGDMVLSATENGPTFPNPILIDAAKIFSDNITRVVNKFPTPTPDEKSPSTNEQTSYITWSSSQVNNIEVFFSYSHHDEKLRDQLDKHLSTLKRQGLITWYDREIAPGQTWNEAIDKHLNTASIILLLISPNFMHSEYCYTNEMTRALERHNTGKARVIPIILSPTDLIGTPFAKLQALPKGAKPVTRWTKREEAFHDIVMGIRKALEEMYPEMKEG